MLKKNLTQKQVIMNWIWIYTCCTWGLHFRNAEVFSQWLGWAICSVSCLIWIMMGVIDKDIPRTLMEVMYFIIGIRAVINWIEF